MSNSLDPNLDQHSVGPDMGRSVCKDYQQMTKFLTSKEGVNSEKIQQTTKKDAKVPRLQQVKQSRLIIINDHWCFGIGLDGAVCMCGTLQYAWFV